MGPYRSNDCHGINFWGTHQLRRFGTHIDVWIALMDPFARHGTLVAHAGDFRAEYTLQIAHNIRAPVSIPDYPELDRATRLGQRIRPRLIKSNCGARDS